MAPLAAAALLLAQTPTGVGDGAPTSIILTIFLQAFARGSFSTSVALPPTDNVHRVGNGYVQDFQDSNSSQGFSFLIALPDSVGSTAFQMCCEILQLYNTLGGFAAKIGYPITDPIGNGSPSTDGTASVLQTFEGNYVLISWKGGSLAGQAFSISDPYLTPWRATSILGLPVSQPHNTASRFGTSGTQQDFQGGTIIQITSGARNGQTYAVSGAIYQQYFPAGVGSSFLGYPIGAEMTVSGKQRQNFEGGYMDYVPGSGQPAQAHAPVLSVVLDNAPLNLQLGDVVQKTLSVFDNLGTPLTDRPVVWSTSNKSVVQVDGSGLTVTLRAVGVGFADVVAYVDGVSSPTLHVTVTSICCQAGEGSPNAIVQQAIQDALARNKISPRLPTDNPVRRMGAGYVQEFTAATPATLGRVLVVKADSSPQAYAISGDRLPRFQQLGGVVGALGFATSDANQNGRQLFQNNYALAGSPPALVAAPVTPKWASLGYETGAAGLPAADASSAGPTAFGSIGVTQAFANGVIYGFTSTSRAGQSYFVSGLILARYNALSGPAGILGLPVSDASQNAGRTEQSFEGGPIDFAPGDSVAVEHPAPRTPALTLTPSQVAPGGRVHVAISGFGPGRQLAVTLTSQPDFQVTPSNGSYNWDLQVRPGTAAGTYRVSVRDPAGTDRADGAYTVRAAEAVRYQLSKVSGDSQNAFPGSQAPLPLVVRLTDETGNPIAGGHVGFGAIGGAATTPPNSTTDGGGYAQAQLRMPPASGLVLANAQAGNNIVTFSAHAQDGRLTTFPTFRQDLDSVKLGGGGASIHQKGSLLTALAALFRYYQDLRELPAASGLADPPALNQFLTPNGFLPFTLKGRQELVVNPLRALDFVSGAADFEAAPADLNAIRDSVNLRSPVLLGLMLQAGDQNRGAHYVVATGVGPDGSILIYDPSTDWNRTALAEYLTGFTALGQKWTASLLYGLRLHLGPRPSRGLLVYAPGAAQIQVSGNGGSNAYSLRLPALAAFDDNTPDNGDTADLWYLDGMASQYQLIAAAGGVTVQGPTPVSSLGPGTFRINPDPASFSVTPQTLTASADGLRNAAGFGSALAQGSLASLFGSGLADALALATQRSLPTSLGGLSVAVGGLPTPLLFVSPFQANLQLPFGLSGTQTVEATSKYGTARFDISLLDAAPGIFLVGPSAPAVLNQDGTLNAVLNPAARGSVLQVFATGLGAVAPSVTTGSLAPPSPLSYVSAAVTAAIDGQPAQVLFAGLAPGFAGLYQVNILIPSTLPPRAAAPLVIHAAGQDSNTVPVAVQ